MENWPCGSRSPVGGGLLRTAERVREYLLEGVVTFLFPPRCVACGAFETDLCAVCRDRLVRLETGCPRCGRPGVTWSNPSWCGECLGLGPAFRRATSAFAHEGPAREMIHSLKFEGRRSLVALMAVLARPAFLELVGEGTRGFVTWVPSHGSVERHRGYNQAEVLARALAREAELPAGATVRKVRRTKHQQGLDRQGRQTNLRNAFAYLRGAVPSDREAVILVDDVYTTGATASAVASVLAEGTGLPIDVFTFGRTLDVCRDGLGESAG